MCHQPARGKTERSQPKDRCTPCFSFLHHGSAPASSSSETHQITATLASLLFMDHALAHLRAFALATGRTPKLPLSEASPSVAPSYHLLPGVSGLFVHHSTSPNHSQISGFRNVFCLAPTISPGPNAVSGIQLELNKNLSSEQKNQTQIVSCYLHRAYLRLT